MRARVLHAKRFLRVHANGGRATSSDALEEALAKAFATEGVTNSIRRGRHSPTALLDRDGVLGVLFPATTNQPSYQLLCGNARRRRFAPTTVGGFRPLAAGLHKEVLSSAKRRRASAFGQAVGGRHVQRDYFYFNAEGRLRGAAQLAQEETLELTPGSYVALCRFEPTNAEACVEVNRLAEAD
jgi:hypothetical protein